MMRIKTVDFSKFEQKDKVLKIENLENMVVKLDTQKTFSKLFIANCNKVYLDFKNIGFVISEDGTIPVIASNTENLYLWNLNIVNSSPTISVLLRASGSMDGCRIVGGTVGVHVDHNNMYLHRNKIYKQTTDGIFVSASDSVVLEENIIQISGIDVRKGKHPDAIQLAGKESNEYVQTNIGIYGNTIRYGDERDCQGIVHSDGMLVNSFIHDNVISTHNDNGIRVNRVNSCEITDNTVSTSIYVGSQKQTSLESNSNKIVDNMSENLYIYNAGDTIVKGNHIRSKYLVFDKHNVATAGVQSDD